MQISSEVVVRRYLVSESHEVTERGRLVADVKQFHERSEGVLNRASKRLMRDVAALLAKMNDESTIVGEHLKSDEAREAFRAFAERRPSNFSKFTS
jgi:enoyl-CoA hydratase/carnithine racemase